MSVNGSYVGKKVFVSVNSMNSGTLIRALRLAVGIATGSNPHSVSLFFTGDGVVNCLNKRQEIEYRKYYMAAKAHGISIYVDNFCLNLRGLDDAELRTGMHIIKRNEILSILSKADLHVRL